jgi:non-heme chloroperoxidase
MTTAESSVPAGAQTITEHELAQCERANQTGRTPYRCWATRPTATGRVPLTYEQFRYGFANAISEEEAHQLYEEFAVPTPGKPLFQAASANLNPWTEAKVDTHNPERGPLLIISGEQDHTVPWAIANASFQQQQHNQGVTEIVELKGRGHALTIDSGWREVADTALTFAKRFTS